MLSLFPARALGGLQRTARSGPLWSPTPSVPLYLRQTAASEDGPLRTRVGPCREDSGELGGGQGRGSPSSGSAPRARASGPIWSPLGTRGGLMRGCRRLLAEGRATLSPQGRPHGTWQCGRDMLREWQTGFTQRWVNSEQKGGVGKGSEWQCEPDGENAGPGL